MKIILDYPDKAIKCNHQFSHDYKLCGKCGVSITLRDLYEEFKNAKTD